MNPLKYLARMSYVGPIQADIETLRALQFAHLKAVPFENLDISLGRKIRLDEAGLWNKLIDQKRGGFCYEVNGLFAALLTEIGFDVTYLNARDYHEEDGSFGIDFDHLTLMVRTQTESTRWLVDVGWGDTFTQPLDIDMRDEQVQGLRGYWIEPFQSGYQLWQRGYTGKRERQYYFDLIPHTFPTEYEETCIYHQTSPLSPFTKNRIITRATDTGRISLDNDRLIKTENGERTERQVREEERAQLLQEHFGVILGG